jgi:hypothetical protein
VHLALERSSLDELQGDEPLSVGPLGALVDRDDPRVLEVDAARASLTKRLIASGFADSSGRSTLIAARLAMWMCSAS